MGQLGAAADRQGAIKILVETKKTHREEGLRADAEEPRAVKEEIVTVPVNDMGTTDHGALGNADYEHGSQQKLGGCCRGNAPLELQWTTMGHLHQGEEVRLWGPRVGG